MDDVVTSWSDYASSDPLIGDPTTECPVQFPDGISPAATFNTLKDDQLYRSFMAATPMPLFLDIYDWFQEDDPTAFSFYVPPFEICLDRYPVPFVQSDVAQIFGLNLIVIWLYRAFIAYAFISLFRT